MSARQLPGGRPIAPLLPPGPSSEAAGGRLARPPAHRTTPCTLGSPEVPLPGLPAAGQRQYRLFLRFFLDLPLLSYRPELLPGPSPDQGPRIPYLSLCFRDTDLKQRGSLETSWMGMPRRQVSIWFLELAKGSCLFTWVRMRSEHGMAFSSNMNHWRNSPLTVIHSGNKQGLLSPKWPEVGDRYTSFPRPTTTQPRVTDANPHEIY